LTRVDTTGKECWFSTIAVRIVPLGMDGPITAANANSIGQLHRRPRRPGNSGGELNSHCHTITVNDIQRMMAKLQEFAAPPAVPDVFLMTSDTREVLREVLGDSPPGCVPCEIYGIPYEVYPTAKKVNERTLELWAAGKIVRVVHKDRNRDVEIW
jgi:hypothetical protein